MNRVVIAIHGVGEAVVGDTARDLAKALSPAFVEFTRNDLLLNGLEYFRVTSCGNAGLSIIEVNWADVGRPRANVRGVVVHIIQLIHVMLRAAHEGRMTGVEARAAYVYRLGLEGIIAWTPYPVFLCAIWSALASGAQRVGATVALVSLVAFIAWIVHGWSRALAFGGSATVMLLVMLAVLFGLGGYSDGINQIASMVYGYSQIVAVIMLIVVALEMLTRMTFWSAVTYLAFAYAPFVMLSALGAVQWLLVLYGVERAGGTLDSWATTFLESLPYDLRWAEWSAGGATFAIICLWLIGAGWYSLDRWVLKRGASGQLAQNWVAFMVVAMPFLLCVPVVAIAMTFTRRSGYANPGQDVIAIYTMSAARILPAVAFLIPSLAIVLKVVGDVVFYVGNEESPLTAPESFRIRLSTLLAMLRGENVDQVLLLGHSQGSVIAHDVLVELTMGHQVQLLTMGSPLASLYRRFLGRPIDGALSAEVCEWINAYRDGDYIGGPIRAGNISDKPLGCGGHVFYWRDPRIAQIVLSMLSRTQTRPTSGS